MRNSSPFLQMTYTDWRAKGSSPREPATRAPSNGSSRKSTRCSGDAAMFQYAQVYAQARQLDRAFEALDKGLAVKDPGVTGVTDGPFP